MCGCMRGACGRYSRPRSCRPRCRWPGRASSGFENGDECAYIIGPTQGTPGQLYNQVIKHRHYLTQEEFSNRNFFKTGGGCLQSA